MILRGLESLDARRRRWWISLAGKGIVVSVVWRVGIVVVRCFCVLARRAITTRLGGEEGCRNGTGEGLVRSRGRRRRVSATSRNNPKPVN